MGSTARRVRIRSGWVAATALAVLAVGVGPGGAATGAPAPATSTTEPADATLGYRGNARHDSFVAKATAAPPFTKLWSADLGSAVSAPVAVGGKVFVVVNAVGEDETGGPRMELVGLDAATGKRLWPQRLITDNDPKATLAYGGGLLYTQTGRGVVTAWDPATGRQRWSHSIGSGICEYPPTWYDGVLYTQDGRGTAMALRASDGAELWRAPLVDWGISPVVVDDLGVWFGFDNYSFQLLDRSSGRELRRYDVPDFTARGGNPIARGAGALWLRSSAADDERIVAYDQNTGAALRSFPADATPAFGPGRVYVAHRGVVKALGTTTYQPAWSYTSPRQAATVRLVAGGYVYVQDGNGKLVVLNERTGAVVWSYRLWAEPHPMENVLAEEDWRGWVNPGIATAGGRVFAPGQNGVLTAFGQ
ncbi:outer membrane protein assembly factor BamB family protein [Streptomyces sp. DH10]|uniref:outer membrane protein assembly factor BamB family protein n=1 Tax=Streptomyces sp. DH10 TaxID=3040121 RepID=UPI0024422A27|nr:PQQ-binding-like beta-propeller repeat protein [Streptomyces sp. DH10]MDG9706794.1 PQQ-binding-like beta-propeller repeat protein [Streptomyces sp. DH10]